MSKKSTPVRNRAAAAPRRATPLSPAKRAAFTIVALLVSFAALGVLELGCRAFGLGGYPPLLKVIGSDGSRRWIGTNRLGTDTFFYAARTHAGGMREVHFTDPKPPGTVRIVLVGGSAIQGFPQPLPMTDGSFLHAMLQDLWGDGQPVEVLNLGATAVASFPVLRILDEALAYQPDVVVVMSGNNEFYGAYGVASLHAGGRSLAGMKAMRWLRSLGLTQFFDRILPQESRKSGRLMEQMARVQTVGPHDALRRAAARTLQADLSAMVTRCRATGTPIVLCTIPTNERDMAPIGGGPHAGSAPADSAQMHFDRARGLSSEGRHDEALAEYVRARDLDPMPWRATSAARDAILAAALNGATLCDEEAAFRASSPGGAIGGELMDDHVHFSVAGQALFARTLLPVLAGMPGLPAIDMSRLDSLPDASSYAERLGRSIYTDYVAATRIEGIFGIPFMKQNNPEAARHAEARSRALFDSMSATDHRAVERWRDPGLHGATEYPLTLIVGGFRMDEGDYKTAEPLFQSARASVPTGSLWRLQSTWEILVCRRHLNDAPAPYDDMLCREAIATGELLSVFGYADEPEVQRYLGLAYHLTGNYAAAIRCLEVARRSPDGGGNEVVAALADCYRQTGRPDAARPLLQQLGLPPE